MFPVGTLVEVYSNAENKWITDGEVVEVAKESGTRDKIPIVAGSTKIVYDQGQRFKWVAALRLQELVRESPRPSPPEPLSMYLELEIQSWLSTWWKGVFIELRKGTLFWWDPGQDGDRPAGSIRLLGAQLEVEDMCVQLSADPISGTIYRFKAEKEEEAADLVRAVREHAAFCDEEREYFQNAGSIQNGDPLGW